MKETRAQRQARHWNARQAAATTPAAAAVVWWDAARMVARQTEYAGAPDLWGELAQVLRETYLRHAQTGADGASAWRNRAEFWNARQAAAATPADLAVVWWDAARQAAGKAAAAGRPAAWEELTYVLRGFYRRHT